MNVNGIVGKLEKNATVLSLALGAYGRSMEGDVDLTSIVTNAPFEAVKTFHSVDQIKWKFWNAPHVPQALFKIGVGLVLASELGLVNKKALGNKIAKGAALACIVTPGSGPSEGGSGFSRNTGGYGY